MARVLHRIGHAVAHHALLVLVAWAVIAAGLGLAVARVGADTSNNLSLPGTGSQEATDLLAERFPPQQNGASPIVFHVASGTLDAGARRTAIAAAAEDLAALPGVASAPSPFTTAGAAQLSDDAATAFIPVLLEISTADLTEDEARRVLGTAEAATRGHGIEVAAGGSVGAELSSPDTESSEVVGIVLAMVILAVAFGTIVAMGLPIVTAVVGLGVGLAGIGLIGHLVQIPDIAPTLATMIGLGVGIDYSLFLVRRHRRQLAAGMDVRESIALTVGTSGTAVVFAGGTVIIALLCLAVAQIPLVTSLGYASAIAVLTAVLAAITLLPAILSLLGRRVDSLRVPGRRRAAGSEAAGAWAGWGRLVTRHPVAVIAAAVPVLAILAVPVLWLQLGQEDVGATPTSTTERRAYDMMAAGFGVGYNGPLLIAVKLGTPATADPAVTAQERQLTDLQAQLEDEQAEGEREAASLQRQADELEAEQGSLERRRSALDAQAADVRAQAAALRRRAQEALAGAAPVRARIAAAERRRQEIARRADGPLARADAAAARRRSHERDLAGVLAGIERLEARAAAAAPEETAPILAAIAAERHRADGVRARIAAARAQEAAHRAEAATIRRRAADAARVPDGVRERARRLAAEAESFAAQAATLEAQTRRLESEAAALAAQGRALEAQAAELQRQEAQLEQLQATATAQEAQAEQLKAQLTAELTTAGGDDRGTDPRLVRLQDALTGTDDVTAVSPPQINDAGDAATFTVIAGTAPAATETADLVETLRSRVIPRAVAGEDLVVDVGGTTAANVDLASEISARLPLVIGVVLALSFVVLMLAFRSLLVPLQAALVNLLCVAAAFGVLTAAFQWGWGIGLFGIDTASDTVPIASYVPLMMFAGLFGLSMDYQVFLLSQVAQSRDGTDERAAVARGVAHSAPVITAAALIMIGVFGSFVLNGDPTVKQFGVGLSVAVLLAAASVLALVPALLVLMGRGTWALPRPLARLLPDMDIEGNNIARPPVPEAAPEPGPGPAPAPDPGPSAASSGDGGHPTPGRAPGPRG